MRITNALRERIKKRRLAAVHEAGHIAVARSLGCKFDGLIAMAPSGVFVGVSRQTSSRLWRNDFDPTCRIENCTAVEIAAMKLGGYAAECIWQNKAEDAMILFQNLTNNSPGSGEDFIHACSISRRDIEATFQAFKSALEILDRNGPYWTLVTMTAHEIIADLYDDNLECERLDLLDELHE